MVDIRAINESFNKKLDSMNNREQIIYLRSLGFDVKRINPLRARKILYGDINLSKASHGKRYKSSVK